MSAPIGLSVAAAISKAQSGDVVSQLRAGVRVLDLRVVKSGYRYYSAHGLLGVPTEQVLDGIRYFLDGTRHEVVVVKLGTGSSIDASDFGDPKIVSADPPPPNLGQLLRDRLGDRMIRADEHPLTATIGELTSAGSRVLVLGDAMYGLQDASSAGFSLDNLWMQTDDPDTLKIKVKSSVEQQQSKSGLCILSWVMTPGGMQVVTPGFDLQSWAQQINPQLGPFLKKDLAGKRVNVIQSDFVEIGGVVDLAIAISNSSPASNE